MHPPRILASFLSLLFLALGRVAAAQEPAAYTGVLELVRYDMPIGLSTGYAPTRQLAQKREGDDAVDWPDLTLNGQPAFTDGPRWRIPLRLRQGAEAKNPLQTPSDDVIRPGNHWFRPMEARANRRHIYTADKTARTANSSDNAEGRYELWLFPLVLKGEGPPAIKNVRVRYRGRQIYRKDGPWRKLTLLLPASEPGQPYEIGIDERPPFPVEVGFLPTKLGAPQDVLRTIDMLAAGEGPKIHVRTGGKSDDFPNPKAWEADLAQMRRAQPAVAEAPAATVGAEPIFATYAVQLPQGRSGGFFGQGAGGFTGMPGEYAQFLAEMGFTAVFDQANAFPSPEDPKSLEQRAHALAAAGVRLGVAYDQSWNRPSLQHPNLGFFAHTLPEWHGPLYRSLSLTAQRLGQLPNFCGISIGAESAGYTSHWPATPPSPDRPWGEAAIEFLWGGQPRIARAPSAGALESPIEYTARDTAEFMKYAERYDLSFRQYGYFAEAVREANPRLLFMTSSYGSSAGNGGRGGWPWASVPGRLVSEGLPVQQVYDANELHSAKPMHSVALIDRVRSYWPERKTWALLDNSRLFFSREAHQRACALALTRGIQGLGTNFLPRQAGDGARPDAVAYLSEMNRWAQRYGGVFAATEPVATIGVFYGHGQALQRRVITGENPSEESLYRGSHEGKVTEALFLCHAAGWPARVITYQEVRRAPLPDSMKVILLTGLDQVDASWHWAPGLEKPLQEFLARGGRILLDDESSSPVPATRTGLRIAAYQPQSEIDATPLLLARNRANIVALRTALEGVEPPVASSQDPTLWALPTVCKDVQYVTAVNQASVEGAEAAEFVRPADPRAAKPEKWKTKANASVYVPRRQGSLVWKTDRPIYDVRLGRKISPEEAQQVDLTMDAFRWYALPPAEVTTPQAQFRSTAGGRWEAVVTIGEGAGMRGVPVSIRFERDGRPETLAGISGTPIVLPFRAGSAAAEQKIQIAELLSGLTAEATLNLPATTAPAPASSTVQISQRAAMEKFAARKNVALTIALTPAQEKDKAWAALAKRVEDHYRALGRVVARGEVSPAGIVVSLQPNKSPHRYPQWLTVPTDLVLFGASGDNVLILDQARAHILPPGASAPVANRSALAYTRSPFVGEYDALNIIAGNVEGAAGAVNALLGLSKAQSKKK